MRKQLSGQVTPTPEIVVLWVRRLQWAFVRCPVSITSNVFVERFGISWNVGCNEAAVLAFLLCSNEIEITRTEAVDVHACAEIRTSSSERTV